MFKSSLSVNGLFCDFKLEENKFYYDPLIFTRLNSNYTERVNKKTLILELIDG